MRLYLWFAGLSVACMVGFNMADYGVIRAGLAVACIGCAIVTVDAYRRGV